MSGSDIDLNHDGIVDEKEMDLNLIKRTTQRRMAIVSLIAILATGFYIAFGASPERLASLGSLLDLFWITLGGVIATYMGSEAYTLGRR